MNTILFLSISIFALPELVYAQDATILDLTSGLVGFLTGAFFTFLLALAFLFFVINVIRYFIIGGTDDEGRKNAKALALYGVNGFVLILIFFGIVNLFTGFLGFKNSSTCIPGESYFFGADCLDKIPEITPVPEDPEPEP